MARTVIIIGGTSGLGLQTAKQLAAGGSQVVVTGRDLSRLARETHQTSIRAVPLDLGSLASARSFGDTYDTLGLPDPDALILNAGQQGVAGPTWTADGFESTMGVNVMAPLALLDSFVPRLRPGSRVIWTASGTHNPDEVAFAKPLEDAALDDLLHPVGSFAGRDGFHRYATSKLCVVRLVPELARLLAAREVRVNAFDPGLMPGTRLARDFPPLMRRAWSALAPLMLLAPGARKVSTSARNLAALAVDARFARMSGAYVVDQRPSGTSVASFDLEAASILCRDALAVVAARHLTPAPTRPAP